MVNADITNYSSIKLDYLFCIIGIKLLLEKFFLRNIISIKY
jgi:hypothetical protein